PGVAARRRLPAHSRPGLRLVPSHRLAPPGAGDAGPGVSAVHGVLLRVRHPAQPARRRPRAPGTRLSALLHVDYLPRVERRPLPAAHPVGGDSPAAAARGYFFIAAAISSRMIDARSPGEGRTDFFAGS